MKVLVTGVSGLLGVNLALAWSGEHTLTGVYHNNALHDLPCELLQVDLSNPAALEKVLDRARPDAIVNCAAMANVDACEENPTAAQAINAEMPGRLAKLAKMKGIQLLHISTDAVFNGETGGYKETDAPDPLGVYAQTKLQGEHHVLTEYPGAIVARVNFFGCSLSGSRSLVEFFYNNLSAGKSVSGFTDVTFCPLYVEDLAEVLLRMLSRGLSGVYHTVGAECLSKYAFGVQVARTFGLDENLVRPSSWRDVGLRARRSPNLCLDTGRLRAALDGPLPGLIHGLERFRDRIESGFPARLQGLLGSS